MAEKKLLQIAIDGPVAAGKSTVAEQVSKRLGFLYVDTGAMYRAVALAAKRKNVSWEDETRMGGLVEQLNITLELPRGRKNDGRRTTVYLDGEDVSRKIRDIDIGEGASVVSQYRKVRRFLVERQRQVSRNRNVIMEGRDIGTRVLPGADLKIYMDASIEVRVRRRQTQVEELGRKLSVVAVRKDVMVRDAREMTRRVDPLRPAANAWILDTTNLSIDEVVEKICRRINRFQLRSRE